MKNKKIIHLLSSTALASALIFPIGTGVTFANEDTAEDLETVSLEETNTSEETNEEVVTEEEATEEASDESSEESTEEDSNEEAELEEPALVPGDFFYFVKLMTEKIRLAVTFDDYKESKLLAEFAAERIAEANALIAKGEIEEAEELLQEAIAIQEQAGEKLAGSTEDEGTESEEATEETDEEAVTEGTEETNEESDSEATDEGTEEESDSDVTEEVTEEEDEVRASLQITSIHY
ncbi:hypothetical protein GCM10008967_12660 [Bacillus carboniphilus]|uniref:DUF5667 domain-containing protein n=1 Tax=Bacillus carboniphilus TaxID=86663 RepID=A0ABP3FQN8_9BACI